MAGPSVMQSMRLWCCVAVLLTACGPPTVAASSGGPVHLDFLISTVDAIAEARVVGIDLESGLAQLQVEQVNWRHSLSDELPQSIDVWWYLQDLSQIAEGDLVFTWLTHTPGEVEFDEGRTAWQATYVLDSETLRPFPGAGFYLAANEQLVHLYAPSGAETRAQKVRAHVDFADAGLKRRPLVLPSDS